MLFQHDFHNKQKFQLLHTFLNNIINKQYGKYL
jgi:hypothetical protein